MSVDMAEYRKMQKLMVKVQDEARAVKQLMHGSYRSWKNSSPKRPACSKEKSARLCRKRLQAYNRRSTAGWTGCPVF
jgi:hypothetical protein